MAKGTISHIEFPADDVERAKAFYAAIAGWDFSEMDGMDRYWLFRTAPEAGGAPPHRHTQHGRPAADQCPGTGCCTDRPTRPDGSDTSDPAAQATQRPHGKASNKLAV